MKNEITNAVYTKSGFKLMSISILIILIALSFFTWGLIRFLIVNPTKYVFDTKNRRHEKRVKKLNRIESKRKLKEIKTKKEVANESN